MHVLHGKRRSEWLLPAALTTPLLTCGIGWAVFQLQVHRTVALPTILLALCLGAGFIASYRFPIHIRPSNKIYMGSGALFLMATLLPPALACYVAVLGVAVGEFSVQSRTDNPTGLIIASVGRSGLLVLGASLAARSVMAAGVPATGAMVLAAVVLWSGDILTFPLIYCPLTGERPLRVIIDTVKVAGLPEGAQYLVGLLGAFSTDRGMWTLFLLLLPTALVYITFKSTKEMHDQTRVILENMADTVDLRDPYTGGHSRRVTEFTRRILRELEKTGPEVQLIVSAARVHDIGKIGIPDDVLLKEGALSAEEWVIMKSHAEQGANLLARYPDFARGVDIIRHHHEAWDGTGYPHRLSKTETPFGARVIAVADSYDAMTSDRPYRKGKTPEQAAAILREGRGVQWDPQLVDALLQALDLPLVVQPTLRLVSSNHLARAAVS